MRPVVVLFPVLLVWFSFPAVSSTIQVQDQTADVAASAPGQSESDSLPPGTPGSLEVDVVGTGGETARAELFSNFGTSFVSLSVEAELGSTHIDATGIASISLVLRPTPEACCPMRFSTWSSKGSRRTRHD